MKTWSAKIILAIVILTAGMLAFPFAGQTAGFPNGPITFVVPFPAGGATDIVFRPLCDAAGKILGQPVVVENRPGGGSAVGVGSIVGKKPDRIPLVEAGKLRLLVTYGQKRSKRFPNVPTAVELGYKVVDDTPMAIYGPKGMPKDVVKILHDAFHKAQSDPTFLAAMAKYDMPILYKNPDELGKYWADAYVEAGEHVRKFMQKK